MGIMHNVVWLLVLIGIMILIHELGHFWAARLFKVRVEVFSIGFGPRLFGFKRGDTDYRFSGVLFGGYVKMAGDQPSDDGTEDPDGLTAKPRWQRLIVAFAGPFMNIVLAIALVTGLNMVEFRTEADRGVISRVTADSAAAKAGLKEGDRIVAIDGDKNPSWEDITLKEVASAYQAVPITIERDGKQFETTITPVLDAQSGLGEAGWAAKAQMQIGKVAPGMPAEKAGLKAGDILVSANGQDINSSFKLQEIISKSNGKPLVLAIERQGKPETIQVQPVFSNLDGQNRWGIGVWYGQKLNVITTKLALPDAFIESMRANVKGASHIFSFLKGIVERRVSAKNITGVIGMAPVAGEAASRGVSEFVGLMAMVSLNLAIVNLMPIPILDGGVILLLLIEMLIGRDLSIPVKEAFVKVGFVFLMVVMVFVLYNDISKILPPG